MFLTFLHYRFVLLFFMVYLQRAFVTLGQLYNLKARRSEQLELCREIIQDTDERIIVLCNMFITFGL